MINVGLLYDSVSPNTGDAAIGVCLKEFCRSRNYIFSEVSPFGFDVSNCTSLIIGGGFLIREPGDEFYDSFRQKGPYMLNGVGLAAKSQLGYLNDYKLVSVRSETDKLVLEKAGVKGVKVVPCITTRMEGSPIKYKFSKRSIGVHLTADTLIHVPQIYDKLIALPHDKVFMPFTHYNKDRNFMAHMPGIEDHLLLDNLTPKELFTAIGKMELIVTSSLHASIFAYLQNVPFLTIFQEKTFNYFKDRGLENYIYKDEQDFYKKLDWLIVNKHDFTDLINQDKKRLDFHLNEISEIIESQANNKLNPEKQTIDTVKNEQLKVTQLIAAIETRDTLFGKLKARLIDSDLRIQQLSEKLNAIDSKLRDLESSRLWRLKKLIDKLLNRD